MDLSIIIVNYNVRYFLEQCLYTVRAASRGRAVEVIVVDNASTDGSLEYLQPLFPEVIFLAQPQNIGFARACNLGWQQSRGNNILFLNPDTLLAEDTLATCLQFLQQHPDAGALGVRMIDGSGFFLKESKRGLPGPLTSLYKLSGLAGLFPRSPIFARYYLGHLPAMKTHEVEVLAGAFMMMPRHVLQQTGGFDEAFFMYGEDIDLSYRVQKAGFKNYYLAQTTIVHFKGESTQKASMDYVRRFYGAMDIFVKKHYRGAGAILLRLALRGGIYAGAAVSALRHLFKRENKALEASTTGVAIAGTEAEYLQLAPQLCAAQTNCRRLENLQQVPMLAPGQQLVFCPQHFTYKEMISVLQQHAGAFRFRFYGGGRLVGSDSSNSSGIARSLKGNHPGGVG